MDATLCSSVPHRAVLSLFQSAYGLPLKADAINDIRMAEGGDLVSISSGQGVAQLMADGLQDTADADLGIERDLRIFFQEMCEGNRVRNTNLREQLAEIGELFAQESIPLIILKGGCELVLPRYRELYQRLVGDLDILVPEDAGPAAMTLLQSIGYVSAFDNDKFYNSPDHHDAPMVCEDWPAAVEIHQSIGGEGGGRFLPTARIFETAVNTGHENVQVPSIDHRLAHLVYHMQIQDNGYADRVLFLRAIADTAALVDDAEQVHRVRDMFEAVGSRNEFDALIALAQLILPGVVPAIETSGDIRQWTNEAISRFGNPRATSREFQSRKLREWVTGFATDSDRRSVYLAKLFSAGGLKRMRRTLRSLRQR